MNNILNLKLITFELTESSKISETFIGGSMTLRKFNDLELV